VSFFLLKKEEIARKEGMFLQQTSEKIERTIISEFNYGKFQINYLKKQIANNPNYNKIKELITAINDKNLQNLLTWHRISWVDKNGFITINSTFGELGKKFNIKNREDIDLASKNYDQIIVTSPIDGAITNQLIVPMSMSVFQNENPKKLLGTLVVAFSIEGIFKKIQSIIGCSEVKFAIFNNKNKLVIKSPTLQNYQINFFLDKHLKTKINPHSQTKIFSQNITVSYFKAIPDSPLKILMIYEPSIYLSSKLFSELILGENNFYRTQLSIIFIFISFAIFYLRTSVLKPIFNLSRIATKISKNNYNTKIKHYSLKELESLAETLTEMQELFKKDTILKRELNVAKQKAEHLNNLREATITNICHDLKNHIFAISNLSDLMLEEFKKHNNQKNNESLRLLNLIDSQIIFLKDFVDDLKDRKSIEFQTNSKAELLQINKSIKDLSLLFEAQLIRENISLYLDLQDNLPKILFNPRHLKQIISNLISNSIKYSNDNAFIKISSRHCISEKFIEVAIIDNGIGMTEEDVEKLVNGCGNQISKDGLEKSFHCEGLGMKNAMKLIELNNGRMEIKSQKHYGTSIILYFSNIEVEHNQEKENWQRNLPYPNLQQKELPKHNNSLIFPNNIYNIINIDDSHVNLMINYKKIKKIIANSTIKSFDNANEGIEFIKKQGCNLALIDIDMPFINGYECAVKIKEIDRSIMVAAYSSRSFDEVSNYLHPNIINKYISKESSIDYLSQQIKQLLLNNQQIQAEINIADKNIFTNKIKFLQQKNIAILNLANSGNIVNIISDLKLRFSIFNNIQSLQNSQNKETKNFDIAIVTIDEISNNLPIIIENLKIFNRKMLVICAINYCNYKLIASVINAGFNDYLINNNIFTKDKMLQDLLLTICNQKNPNHE